MVAWLYTGVVESFSPQGSPMQKKYVRCRPALIAITLVIAMNNGEATHAAVIDARFSAAIVPHEHWDSPGVFENGGTMHGRVRYQTDGVGRDLNGDVWYDWVVEDFWFEIESDRLHNTYRGDLGSVLVTNDFHIADGRCWDRFLVQMYLPHNPDIWYASFYLDAERIDSTCPTLVQDSSLPDTLPDLASANAAAYVSIMFDPSIQPPPAVTQADLPLLAFAAIPEPSALHLLCLLGPGLFFLRRNALTADRDLRQRRHVYIRNGLVTLPRHVDIALRRRVALVLHQRLQRFGRQLVRVHCGERPAQVVNCSAGPIFPCRVVSQPTTDTLPSPDPSQAALGERAHANARRSN
jgi:hypothetical protein